MSNTPPLTSIPHHEITIVDYGSTTCQAHLPAILSRSDASVLVIVDKIHLTHAPLITIPLYHSLFDAVATHSDTTVQ